MTFNSITHAFLDLVTLNKGTRITKAPDRILSSYDGLEYYFVEVTDDSSGCCYIIEAYGMEAVELHIDTMKLKGRQIG
jgi:hypothetical protein